MLRTSDGVDHPVSPVCGEQEGQRADGPLLLPPVADYDHGTALFTVYGPPGRPDMALFKFVRAILNGEPIDIYNQGQLSRDFTHIDDIVEGIVRIAGPPPNTGEANWRWADRVEPGPYRLFNIGNGSPGGAAAGLCGAIEAALGRCTDRQHDIYATRRCARQLGRHRGAVRGDEL